MKTSVWFSWLIFIVAIAALCVAIVRCEPIKAEWASILVGFLGVIVTALVGWQVYNAIQNYKTLKRLDDLEADLRIKATLMERQNDNILDIIEAHSALREAERSNDFGAKYFNNARALALFLRGNTDIGYQPLNTILLVLSNLISKVDRSKDEDDKILFSNSFKTFDGLYHEIMEIIHHREDDLKAFSKKITKLRDRRKKLFDEYVGKETSADRIEREQREAEERAKAEQDKQAPEANPDTPEK